MQESSSLALTFAFAVIIIFLALAAQFGSFRDPLIVMMSVPMAIFGAMIFIFLGVKKATLNIYTEVGLVTLIGLIRSEEHTSELQSLMRISYAVFCLKKKNKSHYDKRTEQQHDITPKNNETNIYNIV